MSSPYTGPTFEILAGLNHTSFLAHASILEKSEKLRAIVQGRWKDSIELKIVLEDWDPETVGRLLEWLYTGDYESPYPAEDPQPEHPQSYAEVPELFTAWPSQDTKERSQSPLIPFADISFSEADPELVTSKAEAFEQWAADDTNFPRVLNFESTLLAHAKLYVLADYMLLPSLQAQVFQRLKAVLAFAISRFTYSLLSGLKVPIANTRVIGNVMTLVRYVYANTLRPSTGEEPLQGLITTFIALIFGYFSDKSGKMQWLMDEGEDFLKDVLEKVVRNIEGLEKKLMMANCIGKGLRKDGSGW